MVNLLRKNEYVEGDQMVGKGESLNFTWTCTKVEGRI